MSIDLNTFFREVTLRISSSLDIDEALGELTAYLREFIPISFAGVFYFDRDNAQIICIADHGVDNPLNTDSIACVRLDAEDLMLLEEEVFSCVEPTVEFMNRPEGVQAHFSRKYFPELLDYSALKLNLRINSFEVGMLGIWAKGFDQFTEKHTRLMESVKDPLALAVSNARRYDEVVRLKNLLEEDNQAMYRDMEHWSGNQVIGADFGLRSVMDMVRQVAPMLSPVLLLGETGTGKEVIANAIHLASPRREAPFVRVQCGAIPESLLDSELFGHEKGAFTGAVATRRGRFERAKGGTVFLDEIAELSSTAQVKLLRVLQEKEFERVGGTQTLSADVRVITATHRNLEQMVRDGTFREDLWFRLNVFPMQLPPLRQRREDIPALVQYFVERKRREMNLEVPPKINPDTMDQLLAYDWPGNVRELQNIIERALILTRGTILQIPPLGQVSVANTVPTSSSVLVQGKQTLEAVMTQHIKQVLSMTNGRIEGPGGTAEILNINPGTLRARMRKLGIAYGRQAVSC